MKKYMKFWTKMAIAAAVYGVGVIGFLLAHNIWWFLVYFVGVVAAFDTYAIRNPYSNDDEENIE